MLQNDSGYKQKNKQKILDSGKSSQSQLLSQQLSNSKHQQIMFGPQSLIKEVLSYLRQHYSIKLDLPSPHVTKMKQQITLNIFKSPLGEEFELNRYSILIAMSEELIRKNIINTEKIKEFGEKFFETINQDIMVLQNNEEIRNNFSKIKDQISYRVEELTKEQKNIEDQCKSINDKEDILTFLEGGFKSYLQNVKVVSEHYESVNKVQVYTSINIDKLYQEKLAHQEDYFQHYHPLLEVMLRLKSNMVKLYQELTVCDYYQLPLKSVNFLANCKNLLTELEPFLVSDDCAFNRLIFHVTRGQKQNNRLISTAFQSNISFTNQIITDVFKSFFLGYIFKDYYRQIKVKIKNQREDLIKMFENKNVTAQNYDQHAAKENAKIDQVYAEIKSLKMIVASGRDKIMHDYVSKKQCKKFQMVISLKEEVVKLRKIILRIKNYILCNVKITNIKQKHAKLTIEIASSIKFLEESEKFEFNPKMNTDSDFESAELLLKNRFKQSFVSIQTSFTQVNSFKEEVWELKNGEPDSYFLDNFYPKVDEFVDEMQENIHKMEVKLLNGFQSLRKEQISKQEETVVFKEQVLDELNAYFQQHIKPDLGFQITNEDLLEESVKNQIVKVGKLEYMLKNYSKAKTHQLQDLHNHQRNLEWLLEVFQGSMDDDVFSRFMYKMNFEDQDWHDKMAKLNEFTKQLKKYVVSLKGIIKAANVSDINQRVFRLVKNRIQVYQIIEDMFTQFLLVFSETKKSVNLNICDHGLKLFDEPTYKYVLMLYQFNSKLRAETQELQELLLPKKTINYLMDEFYEPFIQNFSTFVGYKEDQLLNFTLRLEHALNMKTSYASILKLFEETLSKKYDKQYFAQVTKICSELVEIEEENKKVLELEEEEVIIYNMNEFKEKIKTGSEHLGLAKSVLMNLQKGQMHLDVQIKNTNLKTISQKLMKDWSDNLDAGNRSAVGSHADDEVANEHD